jgi:hypothetical protein
MYFDLHEQKFKYTDGTYASGFEGVTPEIGFGGTGFPMLAHSILQGMSHLELQQDED